jgi:multiple sugar transport system permease protein
MTPAALTPTVLIVMWKYLINFNIGILNYFIESAGALRIDFLSESLALLTLIVITVWHATPWVFMFIYPARITIPATLYESATIDGATAWQIMGHITLPLLKPAIYVTLIFRTIFTLRAFGHAWLLTEGGPNRRTELLAIYLYKEGFMFNRLAGAAAVSCLILIITVVIASYQIYKMYQRTFLETVSY